MALLTRTGLRINRYCSMADFPFFKMASVRYIGFSKVGNFNYQSSSEAQYASSCQISRRSVETFRRYGRLSIFKMAAVRHLGFSKVGNFNFRSRSEAQYASPYQISQKSVKPFRRYGRFSIFQDSGRLPSWIFKSWQFQLPVRFGGPMCVILPNFAKIGQTVPEIWLIFDFSIYRPSAILDLFYACWNHPRRVFGCNRCSNFESMQILLCCTWKFQIFNGWDAQEGRTAFACQILSESLKSGLRYSDFSIFHDGGCPPS